MRLFHTGHKPPKAEKSDRIPVFHIFLYYCYCY
jgi:hypothetical protein